MQEYHVQRLTAAPSVDGNWDKGIWKPVPVVELKHVMGPEPFYRPRILARLAWSDEALHLIFRVEDRFVCARHHDYQSDVFKDSCVEFFFDAGDSGSGHYFNLEINALGTALFRFQRTPRVDFDRVSAEHFESVILTASLKTLAEPDSDTPLTWFVEVSLPFEVLEHYAPVTKPAPGMHWRGNFYKCADESVHPHWLSWTDMGDGEPDFHQPERFGSLVFTS